MKQIALLLISVFVSTTAAAQPPIPPIGDKNFLFLDYPGFPDAHSSWGSIGYSTQHQKVFIGVTNHRNRIGLYEYPQATRKLRLLGFVHELAHLRDYEWQGKIHSYIPEGPDGNMYFSTDGGENRQETMMDYPNGGYSGGYFFRWEPKTERLISLGKGLPYDSLKNIAVDPIDGWIYGMSYPQSHFLVYNYQKNTIRDMGRLAAANVPRVLFTDKWGNGYYVDWRQRLVKYEKGTDQMLFAREPLPTFPGTPGLFLMSGVTARIEDREAGLFYLLTYGSKLLSFRPTERGIGPVEDLGGVYQGTKEPWDYWCRNLSRGATGKLYYFVGGHGRYTEHGDKVVMMEYDPKTRNKREVRQFEWDVLLEVPGNGVTDSEGNIYYAARRTDPRAVAAGDSGSSVPFLMIFNPEKELQ